MSDNEKEKPAPRFHRGDRVKLRHFGATSTRVVEVCGPIGPGGVQVYRIVVVRKVPGTRPIRTYFAVMEDQIEPIPAKV
jgi:hypothetical protein